MLSDDELLDRDASDSIFAKETPREDSPRTFARHLINRFGISSKGGLRLSSTIPNLWLNQLETCNILCDGNIASNYSNIAV